MKIVEAKPLPAPLDTVELSAEEVFVALRQYVLLEAGREVREITGAQEVHSLGSRFPLYSFTLTLNPESK